MSGESVKVIVRCRPLNQRETGMGCKICVTMEGAKGICAIKNPNESSAPAKTFTFDGAYYIDSTTEQIYTELVYPLVENCLEGYNGTVFAYGQTGSGKSFSMQGIESPATQKGIIPRAFEHIFESIATAKDKKFLVHASYLEIYNEEIRDLLGKDIKAKLEVKEHPEKGVYVAGLSMHAVHNVKECEELMSKGWKNRSTGATMMNAESSRSHSIFTVNIETMEERDDGEEHIKTAKLNLVDLAGSERQVKTGATGDRLKEATRINLSLSALGNVISALVDGKSTHIPYRDSKLTRLLQDSLGGNTKTIMTACLSPADNNYDETLSTLRYANRAKNIKNKPKINEDPKDALLREYQEEIQRLKAMLEGGGTLPHSEGGQKGLSDEEIKVEKQKLREEYESQMTELKQQYQTEKKNKVKLEEDLAKLRQNYETAVARVSDGAGSATDVADALKKLELLQHQMLGGEAANDKTLVAKHDKKKMEAEKRLAKLAEQLSKVDGDDPMLKVYDNMQEKLDATTKSLEKERKKNKSYEVEIHDLQSEFELDRIDYLDTIRRQDQQIKLLTQIVEKMQPCMRRDSNYANVEKIKKEAQWDEDLQRWTIPDMAVVKTQLPNSMNNGGIMPGGLMPNGNAHMNGYGGVFEHEEDKLRAKLEKSAASDFTNSYFKTNHTNRIIGMVEKDRNRDVDRRGTYLPSMNANKLDSLLSGVIYTDDLYERKSAQHRGSESGFSGSSNGSLMASKAKPARLESLDPGKPLTFPPQSAKKSRKPKKAADY